MATIKDIAKHVNVSVSTVSYALNGGPRSVPEAVRTKVVDAARELGYRPNRIARSLVTRRTHTIGVVPPEASIHLALTPFFQLVLDGVLNAAERAHQDVLILTGYDHHDPERLLDSLLGGRADGLVFLAPRLDPGFFDPLESAGLPFVLLNSTLRPETIRMSADNAGGARLAVDHLADLGHVRIGHVAGKEWMDDARARRRGFEDAMAARGLALRPDWVFGGDFTREGGHGAALSLLSRPDRPTALFCGNDEMAFGAIHAARSLGLRVPEDVSVVGFDDSLISVLSDPALTTVRQPLEDMGAAAVSALLAAIGGDAAESRVFPTSLIVRASTSRPTWGGDLP